MNLVEDVRKTVTNTVSNPKPLYFAAGVGEAAVEAIKDAPARLTVAGAKAGEVANTVAAKVADAAETVQSKIALGQWQADAKALREKISEPDLRAAREKAQNLLLAQVGRALEVAGKAVETYDDYSERGKVVVDRVLTARSTEVEVVAVAEEKGTARGETVTVDEVAVVEEEKAQPKAEAPKAEAPKAKPAASAAKKPAAPRRTANARAKKADQG